MKAILSNYRQSPRKVRLVTDLVKGKTVTRALAELALLPKRAAGPIAKLLRSAAVNHSADSLIIKDIRVDQGATLKRFMPVSRGRAHRINKRTSQIRVELDDQP